MEFAVEGEERQAWAKFERSCRCTAPDDPYPRDGLCYETVSTRALDYLTQLRIDNLIAILQDLSRVYTRARWQDARKPIDKVIQIIRFDGEVPRHIGCWDGQLLVDLLRPLTNAYDAACLAAQKARNCPSLNAPTDDAAWQAELAQRERLHLEFEARSRLIDRYVEEAGLEKYRKGVVLDFNNQSSPEEFSRYKVINERIYALSIADVYSELNTIANGG
jgi:hypothetical protein